MIAQRLDLEASASTVSTFEEDTHPNTLELVNHLIDLYEPRDKPEQAGQWQAKLGADGKFKRTIDVLMPCTE